MNKKFLFFVLIVSLTTVGAFAQDYSNDPAVGYWKSVDDKSGEVTGVWNVYVADDNKLYGELVWIPDDDPRSLATACTKVNKYDDIPFEGNPAERTVLNTPWLYKLEYESEGVWKKGHIIDPSDGNHYYGGITYEDGKLSMRGSLDKRGWLGRSQIWEPIEKAEVDKLIAEANAKFGIN